VSQVLGDLLVSSGCGLLLWQVVGVVGVYVHFVTRRDFGRAPSHLVGGSEVGSVFTTLNRVTRFVRQHDLATGACKTTSLSVVLSRVQIESLPNVENHGWG
jgi:hypothetical protein